MYMHKAELVRCWKSLLLETTVKKKRKCSFYNWIIAVVEFQLTNIEEMMEFENNPLTTIWVILVWGKNQQWMMKLTGGNMMRNGTSPQVTNDSRETW